MTETKKTPSGKKGPCVKCGKVRYIASKAGHCHTCNNQVKGKKNTDAAYKEAMSAVSKPATTTPDRGKTEAIETMPASQPSKSAPDMTVAEVAALPISPIIDMIKAKRATHLVEAEKLGKAIVLLESL